MPLEDVLPPVADRVAALNSRYRHHSAHDVLAHALTDPHVGRVAMVSSFGAESVALLHLVSVADRSVPVLFLDTLMLFPETLEYQRDVAEGLGLSDVRVLNPDPTELFLRDPEEDLNRSDPDACCTLRKVEPLQDALEPFDGWITGRKRFHGGRRASMDFFEDEGGKRIKVNPLAHWSPEDVRDYITNNRLPLHPLVEKGFPSVGCQPCTTRVGPGEDPRAGRWRGQTKQECGIHYVGGRPARIPRHPAPSRHHDDPN